MVRRWRGLWRWLVQRVLGTSVPQPEVGGQVVELLTATLTSPRRGTREYLEGYGTMPWLGAVVRKVATAIAAVEWQAVVVRQGREVRCVRAYGQSPVERWQSLKQQGMPEILADHPLVTVLDTFNPQHTGFDARRLLQVYLDLTGEAFLLKERNQAGMPVALWPVPPHWVERLPSVEQPYFVILINRKRYEVPLTEVVAFSEPDPVEPYGRGRGTAQALGDELETDEYTAKHLKSWFLNRARPDIIVTADGLSRADTERLEVEWTRQHQGFWRAFKPHFLNRRVDVHELSQTFRDMQLTELRRFERDIIMQVYGVPPEIFGVIENSNRATIEASDFLFARYVLVPRLEFLRAVLQSRLVPDFDERLILEYVSPVKEDRQYLLQVARSAPYTRTLNEWRDLQGLPSVPDGDRVAMPLNLGWQVIGGEG